MITERMKKIAGVPLNEEERLDEALQNEQAVLELAVQFFRYLTWHSDDRPEEASYLIHLIKNFQNTDFGMNDTKYENLIKVEKMYKKAADRLVKDLKRMSKL